MNSFYTLIVRTTLMGESNIEYQLLINDFNIL